MAPAKKARRRKKRKPPTREQQIRLEQNAQKREVRKIFDKMGVYRLPGLVGRKIVFQSTTSDFDDIFVCENIILVVEYTIHKSSELSGHLKKKKVLYDKILGHQIEFTEWLKNEAAESDPKFDFGSYHNSKFKIFVLYVSKNSVDESLKVDVPNVIYFDYNIVKYFGVVSEAVRKSARYELLKFVGVPSDQYGKTAKSGIKSASESYHGAALFVRQRQQFKHLCFLRRSFDVAAP